MRKEKNQTKKSCADDEIKDVTSVQYEYSAALQEVDSFNSMHLGIYDQSDTKHFISMWQSTGMALSFCIVSSLFVFFPEIMTVFLLLLGFSLHIFLTVIKHKLFFTTCKNVLLRRNYLQDMYEGYARSENDSSDLPVYSILLPVFIEEKSVLQQLLFAIQNLDYPIEKMQVLLLLEEIDKETIHHVKSIQCDLKYELIIVPNFEPRTKAKACNYALKFVKGEYVVIFDADDIPSPEQLRIAHNTFKESDDSNLVCLQAKLNYYNANENLITRLFSLEYSILFDKILPTLSRKDYPLPLGGTSNHFKMSVLRELRGWDIYNLAEDAEIGMRLAANGYKAKVIDSYTAEESPVTIFAWIKQRSRWLKGFIQTYLLYLQKQRNLTSKIGCKKSFISLHFMLGLSTMSLIMTPIMMLCGILMIMQYIHIDVRLHRIVMSAAIASGLLWVVSSIFQSLNILQTSRFLSNISKQNKIIVIAIFPVYFFLHTIAALYAVFDLIRRPFYWSKTKHGLTRSKFSIRKFFRSD